MASSGKKARLMLVLVMLATTMFVFGLVSGLLIMRFAGNREDKKQEKVVSSEPTVSQPSVIIKTDDKQTINVYIPARERVYGKIPVNSYIQDNFTVEDGFRAYYDENGEKISHLGVDISYHQKSVDWDKLKEAGVEFVMLRCGYRGYTEGGLVKDEKFDEYARACNEAGIPLGVYFFTQAVTVDEAINEADFVIKLIEDYDISYPVALDTEYVSDSSARTNDDSIDEELRTKMSIAFLERVREAGYYPMIYASENWIRRQLLFEELQEYDFWAPQYLEKNDFLYDHTIWQYTESGRIPGIEEEVDINISMVDYASFVPALREAVVNNGQIIEVSANSIDISVNQTGDDNGRAVPER